MLRRSNINQNATSLNGQVNQAGRDNNILNITIKQDELENITFYEEDIKEVIVFFNECNKNSIQPLFMDFQPIEIEVKNKKNKLSELYFNEIKKNSLPQFGKIKAFLKDSRNEEYVEMYNNTVIDLQNIVITHISKVDSFEVIITKLYEYIVKSQRDDRAFMKIRSKVILFLHFMYYNCDIGIK